MNGGLVSGVSVGAIQSAGGVNTLAVESAPQRSQRCAADVILPPQHVCSQIGTSEAFMSEVTFGR